MSRKDISLDVKVVAKEVNKTGWALVENLFDAEFCEQFAENIEKQYQRRPEIWEHNAEQRFQRLFGYEAFSTWARTTLVENEDIRRLFCTLLKSDSFESTLMLERREGELSKGLPGTWHRDSFFNQYKFFLYFNDIDRNSPKLEVLEGSHTILSKIRVLLNLGLKARNQLYIYDERGVLDRIGRQDMALRSFEAKAGSMLVVNTSMIHRVSDYSNSSRTALTYYVYKKRMPHHVRKLVSKTERYLAGRSIKSNN